MLACMGSVPRHPAVRVGGPLTMGLLLTASVGWAVVLLLGARTAGLSYWGTSWVVVVGFPIAVVATMISGWLLRRRGERAVARWMLATAAALLLHLVGLAFMNWRVTQGEASRPLVSWLALAGLGGHIAPFVLLQAALLAARDHVAGWSHRCRPLVIGLLAIATANVLFGAAIMEPDPPLNGIRAPLGETWLTGLATSWLWTAVSVSWLLSVLVGPVALWRAVGTTTGRVRRRLSVIAVVSLLPVSTIVCCVLLLPALMAADLPQSVAADVLFAFYLFAMALSAVGMAAALDPRLESLRHRTNVFQGSVQAAIGLLFALAAITVSTLAALNLAGGSLGVAVVATVVVVALLWPVRTRMARWLVLRADPRRAAAADLVRQARGQASEHPAQLARQVLRRSLGDPNLEMAVRLPATGRWVSVEGADVAVPETHPPGSVTLVPGVGGVPRAYLVHASSVEDAEEVCSEVLPLLDQAVFDIVVRHQAEQLAKERSRADRAASAERRRLERDLHDGVQGRLLALALDLQAADASTRDADAHLVLTDAVASLRTAIDEVRRLGSGTAPEVLSQGGLGPALAELTRRISVPVSLDVLADRLDPATEVIAYLVVSEAVTNAVKHAGPCGVDVTVALEEGTVNICVGDDGSGGADLRGGTGLRGLAERVNAAGGTFVVSERRPRGTLLEVVLPCGR